MRYISALITIILLLVAGGVTCDLGQPGAKPDIEVQYPVSHLIPTIGSIHKSNVTQDRMTCFGNRDFQEPSYKDTFVCLLPFPSLLSKYYSQCDSIWGSRSVLVSVEGSVEFLQVPRLPQEANEVVLRGKRWLELQSLTGNAEQREIKHIPAEPFFLCARSIHWTGSNSSFQIEFRPVYLRGRDFSLCAQKILLHLLLVAAVSSIWLLPYIGSFVLCVFAYTYGMHRFMVLLAFSSSVVCFTPLMLTSRNRQLARVYISYFFGRRQARETRESIRERLPLFQALFFSCALMCTGSAGSYIMYSYMGVGREARNMLIQTTMGVSAGWFVFVLCRSFENFFHQWSWLVLTACLLQFLEPHLNPKCYSEAIVAVTLITIAFDRLLVPHIKLNQNVTKVRALLGVDSQLSLSRENSAKLQTELFSPVRAAKRSFTEGSGATDRLLKVGSSSKAERADDGLPSEDSDTVKSYSAESHHLSPTGQTSSAAAPSSLHSLTPSPSPNPSMMNITVNIQVERGADEQALVRVVRAAVTKAVEDALKPNDGPR
jgi:hypothetical protein